jgi:exodeoxyribonuclease V gamma subunit
MLNLHFANRYESLAALLTSQIGQPGPDPFVADEVIVPSAALRRQLTLQLARQHGVCTQVQFSYLAQWLWQQVGRVLAAADLTAQHEAAGQSGSPLQPSVLTWRVYQALAEPGWSAAHPRLSGYLLRADGLTRLNLSQRIAALMEQYSTYRPDWLIAWAKGQTVVPQGANAHTPEDEAWQAALWRHLLTTLPDGLKRATLADSLTDTLGRLGNQLPAGSGLPSVAHVFCLPTIAPVHLAMLQQLGRWMDLQVYALNPCREYWFEVVDPRRLARLARTGRAQHHEVGNRLLAAWGQQAQTQLSALVDASGDAAIDDDLYTESNPGHLLGRLQNAILDLQELPAASVSLKASDRSIEVHICHSLTRELEVLQDTLLSLFAETDAPAPSDVLVVCPDLEAAAPVIDAVFGTAPRDRALPFTLTGLAVSPRNAPARALLDLLVLAGSRCTVSDVFSVLQQAVVARCFGLDEDALQKVHTWLQASGAHWALDETHCTQLGLPAGGSHTLANGLERLFLGYALPPQVDQPFRGRLPAADVQGLEALHLGALWQFIQQLGALHKRLQVPLSPQLWPELLQSLITDFIEPDGPELDDQAELQAAIQSLSQQWQRGALDEALPLDVVRQALTDALDDPARGGVPTGAVTFSSMSSLRNLPYKFIAVLGMGDAAFPGMARQDEFDLMATALRRGDRQRRTDERNVFLDLLLAARDRLHLSYTGRSQRDNCTLPPSVLVSELLDSLIPTLAATPAQARAHLVVEHPLQAFAASQFDPTSDMRIRSHNAEYAQALNRTAAPVPEPVPESTPPEELVANPEDEALDDAGTEGEDETATIEASAPFFAQALPTPEPPWRLLSLAQLHRFFRNPSRYLLIQRMGLSMPRDEDQLSDEEPLLPSSLATSDLAERLLPAVMAGASDDALLALARAGTELPNGTLGEQAVLRELPMLRQYVVQLAELQASPLKPPHLAALDFDLNGQAWVLQTAFADLRPLGLVRSAYHDARPADRLAAWIDHLTLCTCAPAGVAGRTVWLGRDGPISFKPVDNAPEHLRQLVQLYALGLQSPLPFFPKSAWALMQPQGSRSKATQAWRVTAMKPYAEQADAAHQLAWRGLPDPVLEGFAKFKAIAELVYQPLLAHLEAVQP